MIKFFRKIRQRLLTENKFGKYLTYAIGEIILVVIGILIALSINNWNENEKLKTEEVIYLKNFRQSLISDIEYNKVRSDRYLLTKESISFLLNHIEQNLPYQDSLKYHFGRITQTWRPKINTEVFDALKSNDLNVIANDSLRNKLIAYYSWSSTLLIDDIDRYVQLIEDASSNIFNTRFNALWKGNYKKWEMTGKIEDLELEMIPNDYEELKQDKAFLYFLRSLKNHFYWKIEVSQKSINKQASDIIKNIDNELKTIKK
jgi:hypothetical protein